jgi:hypothetical protein
MKNKNISGFFLLAFICLAFKQDIAAQKINKTRFIAGLSAPELLHAGITHRITNIIQAGISLGYFPSWGESVTTISLENRVYIGETSAKTNQKLIFFRQGVTYFPSKDSEQKISLNVSFGKDLVFKNINKGITIDAGVLYLTANKNSYNPTASRIWPSLRFEFYFQ